MKIINIKTNYTILGQLLKFAGIIKMAQKLVLVNGELEGRRSHKLHTKDIVSFDNISFKLN
ncbi:MAG: RNA-binding S4 domain-containing protein [Mycoplasma sp.]